MNFGITAIACISLLLFPSVCSAQVEAVEAGSAQAMQQLEKYRNDLQEAAESWKNSKKLTYEKSIPAMPKGQGECLSPHNLSDGQTGYLEYWQFEVMQVIGPTELLLSMRNPDIPPIWISDFPTTNLADDDEVRIVGLVEVNGTKSYETVAGSQKTVRVVRLVSPERIAQMKSAAEEAQRKIQEAKEQQKQIQAEDRERLKKARHRRWSTTDGKHQIDATFIYVIRENVVLEKADGKRISVPLGKLSKADRNFIDNKEWVLKE